MPQLARALGVVTIPVLTMPVNLALSAGAAHAVTIPKPPTKALPAALDVASPYEPQRICDPVAKPGVLAFARLMSGYYHVGSADYGITRDCHSGVTEHSEGRAWDWMLSVNVPEQKAIADSVTAWLSAPDAQGRPGAMARRFGIMYIIWNHRMWRAYDPARGWAPYTGSVPHTDHIHFSFSWDGAYARTSWWTGKAVTTVDLGPAGSPTATPQAPSAVYSILVQGSAGADVALAQKVVGASPDGIFGPQTAAAVRVWQAAHGVPVTGQLDHATWAAMVRLKLVPARAGIATTSTPSEPASAPVPVPVVTPVVTKPVVPPVAASGLAAYATSTIRRGSTGPAVVALQKALQITADGAFGPITAAAVSAFQARHGLPATGVVDPATWSALMRAQGASVTAVAAAVAPAAAKPSGATTSVAASRSGGAVRRPVAPLPAAPAAPVVRTAAGTTVRAAATAMPVLRVGSRGEQVKALQRALGGLAVDGSFGPRTALAVQAFQRSVGIAATGVADAAVWQALDRRDHPLRAEYGTVLKPGSRGGAVSILQKALRLPVDGIFGPRTQAAVKSVQARARLAQTGVVATLTWQAVEAQLTGH